MPRAGAAALLRGRTPACRPTPEFGRRHQVGGRDQFSWVTANVLDKDLQNRCGEMHTAGFPFEKSCTHEDGTVENANSSIFDGIFFGSLAAALVCLALVFTIEASRRK